MTFSFIFGIVNEFPHEGQKQKQQTPWPLIRKLIIPTERPPLVDEM
jgi:hypothetical protein